MQLGALYLQLGQYEAAYRTLGKAARLDPRNPQAHFLHGVALERAGHPDGAALEYENTLRLNPNHPQAAQFRERAQRADAQRRAPQPPATQSPR
jgi:superkiller protein 3